MKKTIVEKAKEIKTSTPYVGSANEEEKIQLALAWIKGELRLVQVRKALETSHVGSYVVMAKALKGAYEKGILK